jgi:NADH dehydrogenase
MDNQFGCLSDATSARSLAASASYKKVFGGRPGSARPEWVGARLWTGDPEQRRELLTFVMAGGGFSGVECVAALEDLLHGALHYYPDIRREELRFILVSLERRLLTEVDERLGAYVLEKFHKRGIDVRLEVGVCEVTERSATLTTGEVIPTRTVLWTGGIKVNPVLQGVDLPKDRRGALRVNRRLQVPDHPRIFAVGDCAAVPLPKG